MKTSIMYVCFLYLFSIIFFTKAGKPVTHKGKASTVRVSAKVDTGRPMSGLGGGPAVAPPMSSIVVERHQPVNKVGTTGVLCQLC